MKILLTGGSGRLGTELQKLRHYTYVPTHQEMDITQRASVSAYLDSKESVDLIVHCAAYTNTQAAEMDKEACWATNVRGLRHLEGRWIPILALSTEYVFDGEKGNYEEHDIPNPKNFYALTKLMGEGQGRSFTKFLRCIFKPRPWPFPYAYADQWTSGDYVDIIAQEVDKAIILYDQLPRTLHIGTGRKSMFELAQRTRPDVIANSIADAKVSIPRDCSLNTACWESIKGEAGL